MEITYAQLTQVMESMKTVVVVHPEDEQRLRVGLAGVKDVVIEVSEWAVEPGKVIVFKGSGLLLHDLGPI